MRGSYAVSPMGIVHHRLVEMNHPAVGVGMGTILRGMTMFTVEMREVGML